MGLIPDEIINAVLDRTDIVAVVGRYVQLKKDGRNFKALCPFHHEKSPSFNVVADKQFFKCFGCGAGGSVIKFVELQERLTFPEAVRFLAEQCGVSVETRDEADDPSRQMREEIYKVNDLAAGYFHEVLLGSRESAAQAAREYLKGRGVDLQTVQKFRIGFAPDAWDGLIKFLGDKHISLETMNRAGLVIAREKSQGYYDRFRNRVIFPIFDIQSRPVAFGARAMPARQTGGSKEEGAKYINSPETLVYTKGRHLFGLNLTKTAVGKLDQAVVVEGYMDMIMPFVHGVENSAASLGTALTVEQIRLIRRYTPNVVMLFDTDPAGQNAIERSLDLLVEEGMNARVVTLAANEDPDSFIRTYGVEEFRRRFDQSQSLFDYKLGRLTAQYGADTIEGRSKICRQMMATINRHKDEVVKFELTKALSEKFKIPVEVILKQDNAPRTPPASPAASIAVHPPKAARFNRSEETLLTLCFSDPHWIKSAAEALAPEDFSGELQAIVRQLWPWGHKEEWSAAKFLAGLQDPAEQALVTRLMSQDEKFLVEPQRMFEDCVQRIQKNRLVQRKQDELRLGNFQSAIDIIKKIKN